MKELFISFLLLPVMSLAQKNISTLLDNYMQAQVNVNEFTGTEFEVDNKGKLVKAYFINAGIKNEIEKCR